MWPILIRTLRVYAPYITLPFAAVVGVIGYNLENYFSDKYTPYNASIKESRDDRLLSNETLESATEVEKLRYKANVLGTNVSPSLEN
ncbi:small integral membrane protein 12-A [Tribolium castaneum]|uniref:Small integral membrane protein 12-A-like Protein n=1 Tax=Tribolium castaneum TaxID=7070 RepID=A0A139WGT4_TRICA|nr:PREDICTED: small integral membrane protein 12-A [Tribolium castaneum]KYB27065.1 Small integral membrane protein 12-A-like Protein [Tribolium castaneum]|eukprot:XP_008194699.1 PREDICTED: small integral membrane protein 12-A [Tribolium castaneum]